VSAQTKILVVEDNIDDVMILQRHFSRLEGSYHVDIAYTASEAIARTTSQAYDIAFIDQHLPDTRGEALIRQIQESLPNLPIIMLTGQGDERLAVEVMKAGASDYLRKDDLSRSILARALRNALARAALQAELRRLAVMDDLTGLYNRRHFNAVIETEFARALRYGQPLACLMLDIDHFKRFNDTRGHPCGDAVLRHLSGVLRDLARQMDIVARYGGEEFALLLPNTDLDGAWAVAERIRRTMAESTVEFGGERLRVTLSIGVATSELAEIEDTQALIKRADDALFQAKRGGRNQVRRGEATAPPAMGINVEGIVNRRGSTAALAYLIAQHDNQVIGRTGHTECVATWVHRLGKRLGCAPERLEVWVLAVYLAPLGRLLVPMRIWNARTPLSADDRARIEDVPRHTHQMIDRMGISRGVRQIIEHLSEHWDGSGPLGLTEEDIDEGARVVSMIDIWCGLRAERAWRPAHSAADAIVELKAFAGQRLDPALVEVFTSMQIADADEHAR
jgi:diguanylate cyclase (GGDEF)-like protein